MYKIKSTAGEVKSLCKNYLKVRKEIVKNRRVKYIHQHLNDRTFFFGKKKYKSVRDVIRYMKSTGDMFDTIWGDLWVTGSRWESYTRDLLDNISNLPDNREIWLTEDMAFLFKYK